MSRFSKPMMRGEGLFTDILRAPALLANLPPPEYEGEKHAVVIDRGHKDFGKRMNFMGPGTKLPQRRADNNYTPLNPADAVAKKHDEDYERISKVKDKKERLKQVQEADAEFIKNVRGKEPTSTSAVARRAMLLKTIGDTVLQTPLFLGSGDIDCDCDEYNDCKKVVLRPNHFIHKKIHNKKLDGGLTHLSIALLSILSGRAIDALIDALDIKPSRKGTDIQKIASELDDMTVDKVNRILLSVVEELADDAFITTEED